MGTIVVGRKMDRQRGAKLAAGAGLGRVPAPKTGSRADGPQGPRRSCSSWQQGPRKQTMLSNEGMAVQRASS